MSDATQAVLQHAMKLDANERAALIDQLVASLDRPDPVVDALWVVEAERRMDAFLAGKIGAEDSDDVMRALGQGI